jgi:predicted enzyme related to lactoylglutathione lyase
MTHRILLVLALALTGCGASSRPQPARTGLQIRLVTIYVDDLDKALRFYTDVMGFAKKDDVRNGGYRWLSVADSGGNELHLALDDNPAAKAFQQAQLQQGQPAAMFYTDDVRRDHDRLKAKGAELTMPPTDVTASVITMVKDTCGNLVQLTQLKR